MRRQTARRLILLEREWKRVWPDDPKRPILRSLQQAYLKGLTALVAVAQEGTLLTELAGGGTLLAELAGLVWELKEIGEWIYEPPDKSLPLRDPRTHIIPLDRSGIFVGPPHLFRILDAAGLHWELTQFVIQALSEPVRRRGAPIKAGTRRLAIKALEEKERQGRRFNLRQFVKRQSEQDIDRVESVRQAVLKLERLQEKLGI
jgi:hypothetical protein